MPIGRKVRTQITGWILNIQSIICYVIYKQVLPWNNTECTVSAPIDIPYGILLRAKPHTRVLVKIQSIFDKKEHLDILSSKTIWFSVYSFSTDRNIYMFSVDLITHILYTNVVNHVYQYDNKIVLFRDNLLRQYQ